MRAGVIDASGAWKNPAHFSRKRACAARNPGEPFAIARVRSAISARVSRCEVACMHCACRRRRLRDRMRCNPRHCLHAAHPCIAVAPATDACMHRMEGATMRVDAEVAMACTKKDCDRLLTVEKTVIRFRPADVPCRSE
jgi:hypothetical protein